MESPTRYYNIVFDVSPGTPGGYARTLWHVPEAEVERRMSAIEESLKRSGTEYVVHLEKDTSK